MTKGLSYLFLLFGLGFYISGANSNTNCSQTSTPQALADCIEPAAAFTHLEALQEIAEKNNGNRGAGTKGYDESAAYVTAQLANAGYNVHHHTFSFKKFEKVGAAHLTLMSSNPHEFIEDKDFTVMTYSASGDITAEVQSVDLQLGIGNTSTSGCEESDFAGFSADRIALIQRGTCPFLTKVLNAEKAGASGVLIFNQGDSEGRKSLYSGTLSADNTANIPVLATTYDVGVQLASTSGARVRLSADTKTDLLTSHNVLAESKTGDEENIIVVGAHLDSVEDGPGINDNGSGTAGILAVALKLKDVQTKNKLRFAFWGAEELGLVGSTKYVESLTSEEKSAIAVYLNFDMIGSKNYTLGVYDGDGSKHKLAGPPGSDQIERLLHSFFSANGRPTVEVEFSGRSDYAAFAEAGIPVGGLFTGAEGVKTPEEEALFGGRAGDAYDSCYHSACDDISNINLEALTINTRAIGFATLAYANFSPKNNFRASVPMNYSPTHPNKISMEKGKYLTHQ